jgi:hypothetical protein
MLECGGRLIVGSSLALVPTKSISSYLFLTVVPVAGLRSFFGSGLFGRLSGRASGLILSHIAVAVEKSAESLSVARRSFSTIPAL